MIVIFVELIVATILSSVLSILLGSILVFQNLAHLPLANILLPANLLQTFKLLISIISFEYFQPFEYIDVDFTEFGSWSPNFAWLGYDSINFLEGLGSIAIIASLLLLRAVISPALRICERNCSCTCCEKTFSSSAVWMSSLTFIHATFYEIVVCASISMRMLLFVDHLSYADKVSIGIAFFSSAIIFWYILFNGYLVCCRSRQLYEIHVYPEEERNLERAGQLDEVPVAG